MTNSQEINTKFLHFLQSSFSACEWYGLICRCFGPHNTEMPLLIAQEAYVVQSAEWAYNQPTNRFFFEELLRLRPLFCECIYVRMDELELTIRRRLDDWNEEANLLEEDQARFVLSSDGTYKDILTGEPHSLFQASVSGIEDHQSQMIYEDILTLSQLPISSFQKVTAIEILDDKFLIYSTLQGSALSAEKIKFDSTRLFYLLAEALDAAHQRDVFHGPIEPHHLRTSDSLGILLGGFGEYALSGNELSLHNDHQAFADIMELFFPNNILLKDIIAQLRGGAWEDRLLMIVSAVEKALNKADGSTAKDGPASLVLVSSKDIIVNLGFQASKHIVAFQKEGVGPLNIEVSEFPSWIEMFPKRIDLDVHEQQVELTIHPKHLPSSINIYEWVIRNSNSDEIRIKVEARRSTWLIPTIVILGLVAVVGLLILTRMAS